MQNFSLLIRYRCVRVRVEIRVRIGFTVRVEVGVRSLYNCATLINTYIFISAKITAVL